MKYHSTYGFIGLGLIGGSLARCLKKNDPQCRIVASSRSHATPEQALADGVIDQIASGPEDPLFSECAMVFLCAPVENNIACLSGLKDHLSADTIITDVGSVKTSIHEAAGALGLGGRFIGGHPMTGSEKSGYAHSNDHLFENAYYIITPSEGADREAVERYRDLVLSLRAIPLILDYRQHDYITAAVSHLPHVIASSLVNTVHNLDSPEEYMKMIAAGGFKDITRIASSSPEMWEQICVTNNGNISAVMDEFIRLLSEARDHMNQGDGAYIHRMFETSRDYRSSFSSGSRGSVHPIFRIYCDIIDEAGAIATIATILAVSGINIKNIGIIHNREFEEGVLSIEFYDAPSAGKAARILRHHRYQVWDSKDR